MTTIIVNDVAFIWCGRLSRLVILFILIYYVGYLAMEFTEKIEISDIIINGSTHLTLTENKLLFKCVQNYIKDTKRFN